MYATIPRLRFIARKVSSGAVVVVPQRRSGVVFCCVSRDGIEINVAGRAVAGTPGVCVERAAGGGAFAPRMPYRDASPVFSLCGRMRNEICAVMCYFRDRVRPVRHAVGLRLDPRGPAGTSGTTRASGARGRRRGFFTAALVNNPLVSRLTPYRIFREMSKEEMPQSEHDEIQQHAPAWACMVLSMVRFKSVV